MDRSGSNKLLSIITGPYVTVPVAVIATLIVDYLIDTVDLRRSIISVILFCVFGVMLAVFASSVFHQLIESTRSIRALQITELESLSRRLSGQINYLDFQDYILPGDKLKDVEASANSIWILSNSLRANRLEPLRNWVLENLGEGTEYVWLVPDIPRNKPHIRSLINYWIANGQGDSKWRFILVPNSFLMPPNDIAIYDAEHQKKTRVVEFILGRDRFVGYEIPEDACEELVGIAADWVLNGRRRKWEQITFNNLGDIEHLVG